MYGLSIHVLFCLKEFDLYLNDQVYRVLPPQLESLSSEELKKISDVKYLISGTKYCPWHIQCISFFFLPSIIWQKSMNSFWYEKY